MRFKFVATVVAGAAILCGGVAATAQAVTTYPTTINYRAADGAPGDEVFSGDLDSPKHACERLRLVGGFADFGSGFELFDLDYSSFHGAWAVRGNVAAASEFKFKVARQVYRHFACAADHVAIP